MLIKTFRTLVGHYNWSVFLYSNSPMLNTTETSRSFSSHDSAFAIDLRSYLWMYIKPLVHSRIIKVSFKLARYHAKNSNNETNFKSSAFPFPSFSLAPCYNVKYDYNSWRRRKIHGERTVETDPENSFWIKRVHVFRLFNHWRKEYKRKHVLRKPKGTKKRWSPIFLRLSDFTFGRGPESFKEYNYLPFVSPARLRSLKVKQVWSLPLL